MRSMTIAEIAMKTKDELIRRGPISGELAIERYSIYSDGRLVETLDFPLADCKVCLLGAAGAARFNDPLKALGQSADDFMKFREALARTILEVEEWVGHEIDLDSDFEVITKFFDTIVDEEDPRVDASGKLGPVLAILDEVARRHPDNTEKEVVA